MFYSCRERINLFLLHQLLQPFQALSYCLAVLLLQEDNKIFDTFSGKPLFCKLFLKFSIQLTGISSRNKGDESCLSLGASGFSDPEAIAEGTL